MTLDVVKECWPVLNTKKVTKHNNTCLVVTLTKHIPIANALLSSMNLTGTLSTSLSNATNSTMIN